MDENTKPVMPGSVPPLYDIPLSQVNRILYKDGATKHPSEDCKSGFNVQKLK